MENVKTAYVHIGVTKTGTSSLQKFFKDKFQKFLTYETGTETVLKLEVVSSLLCLKNQLNNQEICG